MQPVIEQLIASSERPSIFYGSALELVIEHRMQSGRSSSASCDHQPKRGPLFRLFRGMTEYRWSLISEEQSRLLTSIAGQSREAELRVW